ncbi:MAG TPA: arsenate reductase ArsC [Ardenticatenaceae bacterium]|nr:arsenate reductase ArsC [Ardenticatenaceae bacterium]
MYMARGAGLHPHLADSGPDTEQEVSEDALPPARVLFLCTHNSARSQMAEALLRHYGKGKVEVFSAGSEPSHVNPYAVRIMARRDIDISQARSKHLDQYCDQRFDYVITVCDRARDVCPVLPGDPEQIHWSFPDPAAVEGTEAEKLRAFEDTARQLTNRIQHLMILINRDRSG